MAFALVRSPYAFTQEMTHYNVEAWADRQNMTDNMCFIRLFCEVSLFLSFRSTKESEASFSSPLPELLPSTLPPLASECLLPWTKSCTSQVSVIFTVFGL